MRFDFLLAKKLIKNLYRTRVKGETLLEPMGVTWHTTNACNFHCDYCDDGKGNKYPDLGGKSMTTDQVKQVLTLARKAVSFLYITGGEPLIRKDLSEVIRWARQEARFRYIGMTSNGVLIHRQEELLPHLDDLAISLDSIDEVKYDRILNVGPGATRQVMAAVLRYAKLSREYGYRFNVSCVAMPNALEDARQVMNFCFENGVGYSVMPQSVGPYPHPQLRDNPEYRALIDEVMARKKEGFPVWGSNAYYRTIRDFIKFQCYPTVAPRIFPNGDLYYPCSPLNKVAGSLIGARSFKEVFASGFEKHGPIPKCDARCFASCYIETSYIMSFPFLMAWENFALWDHLRRLASPFKTKRLPISQNSVLQNSALKDIASEMPRLSQ